METKPFSLQSPESIAKEYGGNKRAIAQAAQMGVLDPTTAVLAGMFIDRMRNAAAAEQAPTQTVAQEVLAQPQMGVPGQAMPQGQMGVPSQSEPAAAGLAALPVDEQMFDESAYAGGGIVAFAAGDEVRTDPYPMFKMPRDMTPEEFIAQQRAFGIPEDPLADARAKIASMAGESQLDREYAKNMALVQAGLSIAGGTSPNAIQNIAKGSMAGIEQYAKDVKDIKAAEKDLFKMQTEIAKADDARKRGDFEGFQKANERANDLAIKLRRAESEERQVKAYEKQVNRPTQHERDYNLYLQHTREVGENPTAQGFQRFMLGARASTVMTWEDALRIATQQLSAGAITTPTLDEIRKRATDLMTIAGNQAPEVSAIAPSIDPSKVAGLPAGSKLGTKTTKGIEVFDSKGKLIGHIKE